MTHKKDEALKLALEALEKATRYGAGGFEDAKDSIKQALAAPVQSCYCPNCEAMGKELAALKAQSHANDLTHDQWDAWQDKHGLILERDALDDLLSMLVAQPAPVPLTRKQICEMGLKHDMTGVERHWYEAGIADTEAAFANTTTPPAAPTVQEPVGEVIGTNASFGKIKDVKTIKWLVEPLPAGTKLYTTPPAQPAPVQEPTVWTATRLWNRRGLWTCPADIERDLLEGYATPPAAPVPLTSEQQIAKALRQHGLTLVKTTTGYTALKLGQIDAHGITKGQP
jgi:hypothetical protein